MKTKVFFCISIISICIMNVSAVMAQHKVSGRLIDINRESLQGATVLFISGDTLTAGCISDAKGNFSISNLPLSTYKMQISLLGFKQQEQTIEVKSNVSLGTIVMKEDTYLISEVTVTGDNRNNINTKAGSSVFQLSERAKDNSHNVYQAFQEIPLLSVNETTRSIAMVDGSTPVILINGVRRPGAIEAINPRMIESVEVMDNPSAKFLADEGVTSVLNIKLKRDTETAHSANIYGKEMPNGKFGIYGGNYQMSTVKSSFYLSPQFFHFDKDNKETDGWTNSGNLLRSYKGKGRYYSTSFTINAGGDWLMTDKDQLVYSVNINNTPQTTNGTEAGIQKKATEETLYTASIHNRSSYFMGNYNLYYKHSFSTSRHLELTARMNHYDTSPSGWREERSDWNSYRNEINMDNKRQIYRFDANYDFTVPDILAFNLGSNTYFQRARMEDVEKFKYNEAREYVYADVSGLGKSKFSYMLSLGLDIVSRKANGSKKTYVNMLPILSLSYKFNKTSTLKLNFSKQRMSPTLNVLNPINTSTDSLKISTGNPYLLPETMNSIRLSFIWNKSPIYLQPEIRYVNTQDYIRSIGEMDKDVYRQTFSNLGHANRWRFSLTSRVNIGRLGNINFTPFYEKIDFPDMSFNGKLWGFNANLNLSYKQVYLNVMSNYSNFTYSQKTKARSGVMTDATFGWNLPKGLALTFSLRDNMHFNRSWTLDGSYSSYSHIKFKNRTWSPMFGFSYYFRNKARLKYREQKRIYNDESDSFKVSVE